jgi:hypothetical protein
VEYQSWEWIFWINIPVGVLGFIFAGLFLHEARQPAPGRLDLPGLVLAGAGLASLMYALAEAGSRGLDDTRVGECGVAAPGSTTAKYYGTRQSGTLMWTFDHVGAGDHLVRAFARVSTGVAGMNGCAFAVLVSPVVNGV